MKNEHTAKPNENPVREGQPHSIADEKDRKQKDGYPFPSVEDKQFDSQPEFIERDNNESKSE